MSMTPSRDALLENVEAGWSRLLGVINGDVDGTPGRRGHLTDGEMLWEPVPGCWTVRRKDDGTFASDWGNPPSPTPFATIAWRLCHIGISLRAYTAQLFHGRPGTYIHDIGGDVDGMVAFLTRSYDEWRAAIETASPFTDDLASKAAWRQGHVDAHAAEVRVLRELYEASQPLSADPFVEACLRGDVAAARAAAPSDESQLVGLRDQHRDLIYDVARRSWWNVIPLLIELGFPVDTLAGQTALHLATATGGLTTVRALVDAGADVARRDPEWDATPLGHAEYYSRFFEIGDVLDYLRQHE